MKRRINSQFAKVLFTLVALSTFGVHVAAASAANDNWPQWRGPTQNGVAPSANPPITWSETNNIKWKVAIPGAGSATPIIWENQVLIQTAIPTGKKAEAKATDTTEPKPDAGLPSGGPPDRGPGGPGRGPGGGRRGMGGEKPTEAQQFVIMALDRQTGKVLWQQIAREEIPHEGYRQNDGSFASPSGLTDGKHIYAYFGSRGLYCYDMQGKLQWNQDLGKMRVAMGF